MNDLTVMAVVLLYHRILKVGGGGGGGGINNSTPRSIEAFTVRGRCQIPWSYLGQPGRRTVGVHIDKCSL